MKNREILLDVIGDTDEKLIPTLSPKRKQTRFLKWGALGGVCAAAVIACVIVFPKVGKDKPSYIVSDKAIVLAEAQYPEMPAYPDQTIADNDWDAYESAEKEWREAQLSLRNQPEGYQDGFNDFFLNSTGVFLNKNSTDNQAYSPLSLYMALGMSAEITDGNSRQQILDALHQSDIQALRSHSQSIWQANYMDDGLSKCVLANSLWMNNRMSYKKDTVGRLADTYYSSVFSGTPGSDEYNKMLADFSSGNDNEENIRLRKNTMKIIFKELFDEQVPNAIYISAAGRLDAPKALRAHLVATILTRMYKDQFYKLILKYHENLNDLCDVRNDRGHGHTDRERVNELLTKEQVEGYYSFLKSFIYEYTNL